MNCFFDLFSELIGIFADKVMIFSAAVFIVTAPPSPSSELLSFSTFPRPEENGRSDQKADKRSDADDGDVDDIISQAYFNLTQSYGITPSMSRRGNPYDNALAENFFSILKHIRSFRKTRKNIYTYIIMIMHICVYFLAIYNYPLM